MGRIRTKRGRKAVVRYELYLSHGSRRWWKYVIYEFAKANTRSLDNPVSQSGKKEKKSEGVGDKTVGSIGAHLLTRLQRT